jgi:hypothetical protein
MLSVINRRLVILLRHLLHRAIILIGLIAVPLITPFVRMAHAAGVQVLLSQSQPALPSGMAPSPPSSQQEQTIPALPPPRQGSNIREIPLPKVFRGCWRGTVAAVDTITPLRDGEPPLIWLTKVYTLCYRQVGANGKWELTFADSSVADRDRVTDQRQSITVKSVTGADAAELSAYLHFRAPQIGPFGIPTGNISTLDELAHLHCQMTPDRTAIAVRASVLVDSNTVPYAQITWHTTLNRAVPPS